ncbi:hypothetical protein P7L68_19400 [Tistrella mobilis]|uniref:hypothetical protein n=1 Tax=Tistrella mobilis TaxID=171437 RepID=UPI003557E96B
MEFGLRFYERTAEGMLVDLEHDLQEVPGGAVLQIGDKMLSPYPDQVSGERCLWVVKERIFNPRDNIGTVLVVVEEVPVPRRDREAILHRP